MSGGSLVKEPGLGLAGTVRLALRLWRGQRRRWVLFTAAAACAAAALAALAGLRSNVEYALERESAALIGADLMVSSFRPWTPELTAALEKLGGRQANATELNAMAAFPTRQGEARLCSLFATDPAFPFYGTLVTDPPEVAKNWSEGTTPGVLVEASLLVELGVKAGDAVKIGEREFHVAGGLVRAPGSPEFRGLLMPRIWMPQKELSSTGLEARASLQTRRMMLAFPDGKMPEGKERDATKNLLEKNGGRWETAERRKEDLGKAVANVTKFLQLVGFAAVILGGLGLAGALAAHWREARPNIALMRCLGAPARTVGLVYGLQAGLLIFLGIVLGVLGAAVVLMLLPVWLEGILPFELKARIPWLELAASATGAVLWLIPWLWRELRLVVRTPPLVALRSDTEIGLKRHYGVDLLAGLGALGLFTCAARWELGEWQPALISVAVLMVLLGILTGVSQGLAAACGWVGRRAGGFTVRHAFANLRRPGNRPRLLLTTVALASGLVFVVWQSKTALLGQFKSESMENEPNLVLFDIQADQKDALGSLIQHFGVPVIDTAPILTLRLQEVKDKTVEQIRDIPRAHRESRGFALNWEYRVTIRDKLTNTETLKAGHLPENGWAGQTGPIPVSVETNRAKDLAIGIGDRLVFDAQGVPVECVVGSLREVNWTRVRTNFFVIFPSGTVLDEMPGFNVMLLKTQSPEQVARVRTAVAKAFPNVSLLDVGQILGLVTTIIDKAGLAVEVLGLAAALAGALALAGTVSATRRERAREAALLRTLGATGGRVARILAVEFALIGFVGGLAGVLLVGSIFGAMAASRFDQMTFVFDWRSAIEVSFGAALLTLASGWLSARGLWRQPVMEVLRG